MAARRFERHDSLTVPSSGSPDLMERTMAKSLSATKAGNAADSPVVQSATALAIRRAAQAKKHSTNNRSSGLGVGSSGDAMGNPALSSVRHVSLYFQATQQRLESLQCTRMTLQQLLDKLPSVRPDALVSESTSFAQHVGKRAQHAALVAQQLGRSIKDFPPLSFAPGGVVDALEELIEELESELARTKYESATGREMPVCEQFLRGACERGVTCSFNHAHDAVRAWIERWVRKAVHSNASIIAAEKAAGAVPPPKQCTLTTAQFSLGQEAWAVIVDMLRSAAWHEARPPVSRIVVRELRKPAMAVLCPMIQHSWIPSLTALDMSKNPLPGRCVLALAQALPHNHSLIELNLSHCNLGIGGALAILRAITTTMAPSPAAVAAEAAAKNAAAAAAAGALAAQNSAADTYHPSSSGNGRRRSSATGLPPAATSAAAAAQADADAAAIISGSFVGVGLSHRRSSSVRMLNLASNGISAADPAFPHFCLAFVESLSQLEKLSLADNGLGADAVRRLLRGLHDRYAVQDAQHRLPNAGGRGGLHANRNAVGGSHHHGGDRGRDADRDDDDRHGGKAGAAATQQRAALRFLSLSLNRLGDVGTTAVADFILGTSVGRQLVFLDLSWNRIGVDGVSALCTALSPPLTPASPPAAVTANSSPVGSPEAVGSASPHNAPLEAKAPPMPAPPTPTNNNMGTPSNALGGNPGPNCSGNAAGNNNNGAASAATSSSNVGSQLQSLRLQCNTGIGRKGAVAIAGLIKATTTLTALDARWTGLGDEGAATLVEAIPQNRSVIELHLGGNDVEPRVTDALTQRLRKRCEKGLPEGTIPSGACVW